MADEAQVIVKNTLETGTIEAVRKFPDGTQDDPVSIDVNATGTIVLIGPEQSLFITPPAGRTVNELRILVKPSSIELAVSEHPENWELNIVPNTKKPEVPTTVNVEVGADEPG